MKRVRHKTTFTMEYDREVDGRWIAEVKSLSGVLAYGATKVEARRRASAIALRTIADRVDEGKIVPKSVAALFSHEVALG